MMVRDSDTHEVIELLANQIAPIAFFPIAVA